MKCLLCLPQQDASEKFSNYPSSLLQIGTYISKNSNHKCIILNPQHEISKFDLFIPDLIGISLYYMSSLNPIVEFVKYLKQIFPSSKIVVGGLMTNILFEDLMELDLIDFIIQGAGEKPLLNLLNKLEIGEIPEKLIEQNSYYYFGYHDKSYLYPPLQSKFIPIMTFSRGCECHCVYCTIKRSKPYNIDLNEIEESLDFYKSQKINIISLSDDCLFKDKHFYMKCFQLIEKKKMKVLYSYMPYHFLDYDILDILKRVRFANKFIFSVDALTDYSREHYAKKEGSFEYLIKISALAKKFGFEIELRPLMGFPEERLDQMVSDELKYASYKSVRIGFVIPLPGSQLYSYCKERDLITKDVFDIHITGKKNVPCIKGIDWSEEDIIKRRELLLSELQ